MSKRAKDKRTEQEREQALAHDIEKSKERSREQREANFQVTVESIGNDAWLYADELVLKVTYDGHSFSAMNFTPSEAQKAIDALASYLAAHRGTK